MKKQDRLAHDRDQFDVLLAKLAPSVLGLRAGSMFGSPAVFVGRRMAFCVFGRALGVKLSEDRARALIAAGSAFAFRPYGKSAMREWVEIDPNRDGVDAALPILTKSIVYARSA